MSNVARRLRTDDQPDPVARIEIFGPIGSGKTTLYRAMSRRANEGGIRPFRVERPRLALREAMARRGWRPLLAAAAGQLPGRLLSLATPGDRGPVDFAALAACHPLIDRFVADVLFERPAAETDASLSLQRMRWFIRDLADVALLVARGKPGVYLFDESLIMRGIGFGFGAREPERAIALYLRHLPLPAAAIFVAADPARMNRLIVRRDGPGAAKRARMAESLALANAMSSALANRIPVLRLRNGGDASLEANCAEALAFVRGLGLGGTRGDGRS
jgi:hypothetical protein